MTLATLILALAMVESNLNPLAIGDGGQAWGILQIHKCVVEDVNNFYGTNYKSEDRWDPEKSYKICELYLNHWGKRYQDKTGYPPNAEAYAKIWNGGPNGWKKTGEDGKKLDRYWAKVQTKIAEILG